MNHHHERRTRIGIGGVLGLLVVLGSGPASATVIEFGENGRKDVRERLNTAQQARKAGQAQTETAYTDPTMNPTVTDTPNTIATGLTLDEYERKRSQVTTVQIPDDTAPILGANIPVAALTIASPMPSQATDSENAESIAPRTTPKPLPRLHALALRAARDAGVPPATFLAMVAEESAWQVDAISPKGALGLAQLMPATAVELDVDPLNPRENLEGGARYLAQQYARFGTWALALSAYNAGPRRVSDLDGNVPDFPETRGYVARVLTRAARLEAHDARFSQQPDKEY